MILMKFFLLTEKTKKSSTEVGVQIQSKVGVLQKDIEWEFRSSEARSRNLYQETTIACTREDPLIIYTRGGNWSGLRWGPAHVHALLEPNLIFLFGSVMSKPKPHPRAKKVNIHPELLSHVSIG